MSKSYKKHLICGHTKTDSEKYDKRIANRSLRRKVKSNIEKNEDLNIRDVSNVWSFAKDGKQYYGNIDSEDDIKKLNRK